MLEQDIQITNLAHAYRVLDVPHDASPRAIKAAYRQLVKRWHPDRYRPGSEEQADATLMTRLLNAAYARIEDAPLQAGYATPFSAPSNASAQKQNTHGANPSPSAHPQDGMHTEYSVHENKDINEAFYRILAEARKKEQGGLDNSSGERIRFALDFVLGAVFGAFVGTGAAHFGPTAPSTFEIIFKAAVGAIVFAFLWGYFHAPRSGWYWP